MKDEIISFSSVKISINDKEENTQSCNIGIIGEETKNGDLFKNSNGEIFYKNIKIAEIRKLNLFERITRSLYQLL